MIEIQHTFSRGGGYGDFLWGVMNERFFTLLREKWGNTTEEKQKKKLKIKLKNMCVFLRSGMKYGTHCSEESIEEENSILF